MPFPPTDQPASSRLAIVLAGLFLLAAGLYLMQAAGLLPLDYDEYEHAHSAWAVSQGLVPYEDFHQVHPPFFWFAFSPVMRLIPQDFESLLTLRRLEAVVSLAVLGLLLAAVGSELGGLGGTAAAAAALAVMFLQPSTVQAMAEFRIGRFSLALTLMGVIVLGRGRDGPAPWKRWLASGFMFSVAAAFDSKRILLPAAAVLVHLAVSRRLGPRACGKLLAAVGCGAAAGIGLMACWALLQGVDLGRMTEQVFIYNGMVMREFSQQVSLAGEILEHARRQYLIVGVFLLCGMAALGQTVFVAYPFKQYVAPVYLAWAGPMALFLHRAAHILVTELEPERYRKLYSGRFDLYLRRPEASGPVPQPPAPRKGRGVDRSGGAPRPGRVSP
ncbi:MAG: hypothetical protein HY748_11520 [Elusimicrobia bacterium]|nr:hypothetical protein [Elusimicrobiota bacterium]